MLSPQTVMMSFHNRKRILTHLLFTIFCEGKNYYDESMLQQCRGCLNPPIRVFPGYVGSQTIPHRMRLRRRIINLTYFVYRASRLIAGRVQGVTQELTCRHRPPSGPSRSPHSTLTVSRCKLHEGIGARKPPLTRMVKYCSLVILMTKSSN